MTFDWAVTIVASVVILAAPVIVCVAAWKRARQTERAWWDGQ